MSDSFSGCGSFLLKETEYCKHKNRRCEGRLAALRTKLELQSSVQTTLAYTIELPAKSANSVLQAVENAFRHRSIVNLQHLRRFVKPEHLPGHLARVSESTALVSHETSLDLHTDFAASNGVIPCDLAGNSPVTAHQPTLHLLVCAASVLPCEDVLESLSSLDSFKSGNIGPRIRIIPVPLLPPTSGEQAEQWSKIYWPTIYKKNNPFGPHPSVIVRTEGEIRGSVGEWMELAKLAGEEALSASKGEPVGAVIVDRNAATGAHPVVVAGDARWSTTGRKARGGVGNIAAHAVMRAIGLVARKRRDLLRVEHHGVEEADTNEIFADRPFPGLETEIYSKDTLAPGGYLCLDLELYVTHEPCIMCSMAILHSRFGKIVFGQRLPNTGGISADMNAGVGYGESENPQLSYGLFWRPELNWKLLAWQWFDDQPPPHKLSNANTHA